MKFERTAKMIPAEPAPVALTPAEIIKKARSEIRCVKPVKVWTPLEVMENLKTKK